MNWQEASSLHHPRCGRIWIVGASGLGRVFFGYLEDIQRQQDTRVPVAGFLDNLVAQDPAPLLDKLGEAGRGLPVLPIDGYAPQPGDVFVAAMGKPENKTALLRPLLDMGAPFLTLVHPSAMIAPTVRLGTGCTVGPQAVLSAGDDFGDFCTIYPFAYVGEDVTCGACATIFARTTILADTRIGQRVGIWTGAIIPPGVTIGDDATIGLGSVVLKDVAEGTTVLGNPARPVFSR